MRFCISGRGRGWRSYGTSSCPCTTLIPLRNRMNWSRSCWNTGEMQHLPRHRRTRAQNSNSDKESDLVWSYTCVLRLLHMEEAKQKPKAGRASTRWKIPLEFHCLQLDIGNTLNSSEFSKVSCDTKHKSAIQCEAEQAVTISDQLATAVSQN
ncbi:uncharacterized protein C3orf18 homolog isoform X8 [Falco rusticolus]|uniref:uncharacterized protein C3orf18 homolog isoform X8 n=1 Tax=Falco rusticolus TaxID=120794 RepID=UPI001886A4A4|nr:uncharacterized protein C3orf18 homolog isoform X8 [Falco rusticolus]